MHITMQPARHEHDRALQYHIDEGAEEQIPRFLRFGSTTAVKNISVLTGLRLKANQSTKENRFPIELRCISPKTNSPNTG